MTQAICSERDCDGLATRRGWCNKHHLRWWKSGSPRVTSVIVGDDVRRFHSKVAVGPIPDYAPHLGECWIWQGTPRKDNGYGEFAVLSRCMPAHRYAYELFVGPIPAGLHLDHLCRVRICVRPTHLEPVTPGENVLRGFSPIAANARKTHCPHGHPYSGPNLYVPPGTTYRQCRTCNLARNRAWRARRSINAVG